MLQSMGSQSVRHSWGTELNCTEKTWTGWLQVIFEVPFLHRQDKWHLLQNNFWKSFTNMWSNHKLETSHIIWWNMVFKTWFVPPCHFILSDAAAAAAAAKSLQSCPTLCNPIDGSPTASSVPGILQARTLEWVAISFSNTAWEHVKY